MKQDRHITGFYIETVILILVFAGVIMILVNIFGLSRRSGTEAGRLTTAVTLASNAAEAFAAADTREEAAAILNENGNAAVTGDTVTAFYDKDGEADLQGCYEVVMTWEPDGDMVSSSVTVSSRSVPASGSDKEIYTLTTAKYLPSGED